MTVAGAINRETDGPTRNITVRATSADGSFTDQAYTITINDVDEFDVGSVSDTDATTNAVSENAAIGTTVGITASASDADATTNAITYSLVSSDGGRFTINSSTGVVTVASAINRETDGPTRNITVRATSADGSFTDQAYTIAINDVDEFDVGSVSDTDATTNAVSENAAIGTTVGITASASDADATTNGITYSLANDDSGRFTINSTTGVVTVAGAINREAVGPTRNITVRATSADGSFTDQAYTITINDVDEFDVGAVNDTDATTNAVNENATIGTTVGITASASDADATTNGITYSLANDDSGRFTINSTTGVVTVAGAINRETDGPTRNITVRATSADGSFTDQAFTIAINDVDEFDTGAVSDSNAAVNSVAENATNGTTVGITASASDADATNNLITYSLDDDAGGRFTINSSTGVVTVANGSLLNYEAATNHTIIVRATSQDASFSTQSYIINLTDVNEASVGPISDANASANTVLENSAIGTTVGITAQASDPDGTDSVTYSLDDNAGGRFTINSTTGVVTVAGSLDRETAATYNITVRATSTDSSSTTQVYTISLGDVDEFDVGSVSDTNATTNSVNENAAIGTTVGITASASDADATTNGITYSLVSDDSGRFTINSSTGVVTVASAINRETDGPTRSITVRATSADGSFTDQAYTITINDVDEFDVGAVSDTDATTNAVNENATIGTTVGITASASDADATTNGITYSLVSDDSGRFTINSTTGVVTVAGAINREAVGPTRNITVRATSADGSFTDQALTIAINDVDEFDTGAVSDSNAAVNSVAENATNGTTVGITASASDADATNNLITYSLDDDAGGRFTINSSTGVVTVANGSLLNYEAATNHTIIVRATSQDASFSTQSYIINLTDVNEASVGPISDANASANTVLENSAIGTTVGITAQASDPDGTDSVTYSLDDNAGGRFTINSTTGVVTVAGSLDRETAATYNITVRATSTDSSSTTQVYTISSAMSMNSTSVQ